MRSENPGALKLLSMRNGSVHVWSRCECEMKMSLTFSWSRRESAPDTHPASRATVSLSRSEVIPCPGMFPPKQPRTLSFMSCDLLFAPSDSTIKVWKASDVAASYHVAFENVKCKNPLTRSMAQRLVGTRRE